MKGTEIITRDRLKSLGACNLGMELFDRNHPDGQGEYQTLLDEACRDGHADYATWLLDRIGRTDDVLEVEEINDKDLSICFAGSVHIKKFGILKCLVAGWGIKAGEGIEAGEGIKAGWGIEAGWGIKAGKGIEAGEGIKAGWGIEAGWVIEAGEGIKAGKNFGVYAGLRVQITNHEYRQVKAKSKPENLMCGEYVQNDDETSDTTQEA